MSASPGAEWEQLARDAARDGAPAGPAALRQLLSFALDASPYALPVERVREIVRMRPVTPVPGVPADVLGVISLRGEIVQVVDLKLRLGLPAAEPGPRARIVVVHADDGRTGGLLVDAVREVLTVDEESLQPTAGETRGIAALCTSGDRFVSVVDLERVLSFDAEH